MEKYTFFKCIQNLVRTGPVQVIEAFIFSTALRFKFDLVCAVMFNFQHYLCCN